MLKVFADLCLLRTSPSNLPYSRVLLFSFILFYVAICVWDLSQVVEKIYWVIILAAVGATSVLIALLYLLFSKQKKVSRLHKVLIGWFSTDLILEALGIALPDYGIISLALLLWNIFIKANILKSALEISINRALITTVGLIFIHTLSLVEFFWIASPSP